MKEQIISSIMQGVISIVTIVMGIVARQLGAYLGEKREEIIVNKGQAQYNANYTVAKSVYYVVQQMVGNELLALDERKGMFDKLLLEKIPSLTQDEIDHFREAICGEIKTQVSQNRLLQPAESIDLKDVQVDSVNIPYEDNNGDANTSTDTNTQDTVDATTASVQTNSDSIVTENVQPSQRQVVTQ